MPMAPTCSGLQVKVLHALGSRVSQLVTRLSQTNWVPKSLSSCWGGATCLERVLDGLCPT